MNKKGFVTSALLYGILSVYLVLILGTIAIVGNRKIANDKIRQSALDDVQNLKIPEDCFTTTPNGDDKLTITAYSTDPKCSKTVFIPETIGGSEVNQIGPNAFANKSIINVTIRQNISYIYYNAFTGNTKVLFILKGDTPATIVPPGVTPPDNAIWGATESSIRQD